ncbi:hypothetical protein V493_01960 [Pseudogymnoascus sp. VKM F-4281 (FW-2241)]|nr:hypothetical protein V493_01960 [Pseudogymnoascus sp. VKM F-4281 (FW-2241)]
MPIRRRPWAKETRRNDKRQSAVLPISNQSCTDGLAWQQRLNSSQIDLILELAVFHGPLQDSLSTSYQMRVESNPPDCLAAIVLAQNVHIIMHGACTNSIKTRFREPALRWQRDTLLYSINDCSMHLPANNYPIRLRPKPAFLNSNPEAPEPPAMRRPRAEYTIRSELAPICPQHWNKLCRLGAPQAVDQIAGQIAGQERGSFGLELDQWVPQFGNEEHTTGIVAVLVFVRSSGKSPAPAQVDSDEQIEAPVDARGPNDLSNPHESLAAVPSRHGTLPARLSTWDMILQPAGRSKKKANGNFTRNRSTQ